MRHFTAGLASCETQAHEVSPGSELAIPFEHGKQAPYSWTTMYADPHDAD